MIVANISLPAGRSARLFVRKADDLARFTSSVEATFTEEDDVEREPSLRKALGNSLVYLDAHTGIEPADIQYLFLRATDDPNETPLLVCAVATEARVERLLDGTAFVAETFSFQISSGKLVTPAGTIAAFEAWFARVFPDMRLPAICFARMAEAIDALDELDWAPMETTQDDGASLPSSFEHLEALVA